VAGGVSAGARRRHLREVLLLALCVGLPLPWLVCRLVGVPGLGDVWVAALAGLAILGAALMLSWATELAEQDIPQSLALLVLALVSVLPEYAVDLHFAIRAAHDASYSHYAVANMTGANRLLIGLGWAAVVLTACQRSRTRELRIPRQHLTEIRFLLLATIYSFFVPFWGLNVLDGVALLGLFVWYAAAASRGESEEVALVGPPAWLDARLGLGGRRICALALLLFGAGAIFLAAEPFAESLVHTGKRLAVDQFLLVQWVAPLASEAPEFAIALVFAWKRRGAVGLGALISSKVNQWTLLVGALPIAFVAAGGSIHGLPLDARQTEELWLTSAQSLLATLVIADLRFSRVEAVLLAALFVVQLLFPGTQVRLAFATLYGVFFLGLLALSDGRRRGFLSLLRPPR
jgi:cation:H+ antiporter